MTVVIGLGRPQFRACDMRSHVRLAAMSRKTLNRSATQFVEDVTGRR